VHEGNRRFTCSFPKCGKKFGYKHVLQRHVARKHPRSDSEDAIAIDEDVISDDEQVKGKDSTAEINTLDLLTGRHYHQSRVGVKNIVRKFPCPWPDVLSFSLSALSETASMPSTAPFITASGGSNPCAFVFSRAYDLRRHLRAEHAFETEQAVLDAWLGRRLPDP
jgi:hypothetical protein